MLTDKRLAARCRRGDREAFSLVYETYVDDLVALAVSLLGDAGLAEDVVQEVFVHFARTAATFRLTGSLKSYLATCTANRARDVIRRRQCRATAALSDCDPLGDPDKGPLQTAIEREQRLRLQRALDELPYEQREAIVLRLHGGMRFRQIAAAQNVSVKTVQSRYRYGLDRLRTILDGEVSHETRR
jgi:RNA polymerase sigma factor (sigma-70 family)